MRLAKEGIVRYAHIDTIVPNDDILQVLQTLP